jgi:hypothetical protein
LNGIAYQGNRVSQHELRHGDQISLAPQASLRYEIL